MDFCPVSLLSVDSGRLILTFSTLIRYIFFPPSHNGRKQEKHLHWQKQGNKLTRLIKMSLSNTVHWVKIQARICKLYLKLSSFDKIRESHSRLYLKMITGKSSKKETWKWKQIPSLPTWRNDDPRRRLPAGDVSRRVGICRHMQMEMQGAVWLQRRHSQSVRRLFLLTVRRLWRWRQFHTQACSTKPTVLLFWMHKPRHVGLHFLRAELTRTFLFWQTFSHLNVVTHCLEVQ